MKSKTWVLLLGAVLVLSIVAAIFLMLPGKTADKAEIWSEGKLYRSVSLQENQSFAVETARGTNYITVKDGKIAVTEASCPDRYCMHRGFCDGGSPIVCLPNRLEIRFLSGGEVDAVVG